MTPAASSLAENRQTAARAATQPQHLKQLVREITRHDLVVPALVFANKADDSVAPNNGARREPVSCEALHRTLKERLAVALRRRVGIGKSITPKQLAYALQLSAGTIDNLMNGNNDPSGRVLMALLTFFDSAFANEILEPTGCTVAKLGDARAEALAKVAEGMEALRRLG